MKLADPCGCFPTGRHYPGIAHLIKVRVVGVIDEFDPDGIWADMPIAFVDTETTGVDAKIDRIVEVGIVTGRRGEIVERKSWLINPGIPIPKEASDVHGILDEQVADKPSFADVAEEIHAAFRDALPAAYNANFDRAFILNEYARLPPTPESELPPALRDEVAWIDPLVLARELFKGQGESRALGAVAERLGVSLMNAHRATDDAEAALRVLYAVGRDSKIPNTYAALIQEQKRLERLQIEAQRFWRKG